MWTKEECSFNPGLRSSPVDTCAYLFYLFLFFIYFFLIFLNFLLDSHGSHYDSHGSHGSHYDSHGSHYDSHGSLARVLVKLLKFFDGRSPVHREPFANFS